MQELMSWFNKFRKFSKTKNSSRKRTMTIPAILIGAAASFFLYNLSFAATIYWTGGGSDNNWSTAANWNTGAVPGANDLAVFSNTGQKNCTVDLGSTFGGTVGGIQIFNLYTGRITLGRGIVVGSQQFNMAGATFDATSYNVTFNSTFTQTGGTYIANPTGNTTFSGDVRLDGGTFTPGTSSTFIFTGGYTYFGNWISTTPVTFTLPNVTINKTNGNGLSLRNGTTVIVTGTLRLQDGMFWDSYSSAYSHFEPHGQVIVESTFDGGSNSVTAPYLLLNNAATGNVRVQVDGKLPRTTINNSAIILTIPGPDSQTIDNDLTLQNGTVNVSGIIAGNTVTFSGAYTQSNGTYVGGPSHEIFSSAVNISGAQSTVNFGSGNLMLNNTYTQTDGVVNAGNTDSLTSGNRFYQTGGTFSASINGNNTFSDNVELDGGVFNPGNGTFIFTGGYTNFGNWVSATPVTFTLPNVTINKNNGNGLSLRNGTVVIVPGTLRLRDGAFWSNYSASSHFEARGDIIEEAGFDAGSNDVNTTYLLISGTGNQTFYGNATESAGVLPKTVIDKTGGTLHFGNNDGITSNVFGITNNFTYIEGTVDPGSSTVYFSGSTVDGQGLYTTMSFHNVIFNSGVTTLAGDLHLNGNLEISGGTLDASTSNYTIDLAGKWTFNSGTFTPRSGTVIFSGENQSIVGSNTFYGLTKNITVTDTLTFPSALTTIITGTLNLHGSCHQVLHLRSSSSGVLANIDPRGSRSINYTDVKDVNNIGSSINVSTVDVISSGNNGTGWQFNTQPTVCMQAEIAPAPTIIALAPVSGPVGGGTVVTISGTNFSTRATVTFAGQAAAVVSAGSTSLIVTSPVHAAALADVVVTNPDGQWVRAASTFAYVDPPTISSISPNIGSTIGGNTISIDGSAFTSPITVLFGSTAAATPVVVSPNRISVITPTHAAGIVNVIVTNPDSQTTRSDNSFTYISPPTVTSISETTGPAAGGNDIIILGTSFTSPISVLFGLTPAINPTVLPDGTARVTVPAHASGYVNITFVNADGQRVVLPGAYRYGAAVIPLTLTSVTPARGSVNGDSGIILRGTGFSSGATVYFGSQLGTNVSVNSATEISVTAPATIVMGAVSVTVSNADGTSAMLPAAYTYEVVQPVLTLTSITPDRGSTAGGNRVTLRGTGFVSGATVNFGSRQATNVILSTASEMVVTAPAASVAGIVDVTITNPAGSQTVTKTSAYAYEVVQPVLTVDAVTPSFGPVAGGNDIILNGTGFTNDATITIGGAQASNIRYGSQTQLTVTVPAANEAGVADIVVTSNGRSVNKPSAYIYLSPSATTDITLPAGTLKRYLFFSDKNDDVIGVQIFQNLSRLSIKDWYTSQKDFKDISNFKDAPPVQGYETITDGNNYYVNALNQAACSSGAVNSNAVGLSTNNCAGTLYNNVYLFSVNPDAQKSTRDVFDKLMKSLKFNINMSDFGYCSNGGFIDQMNPIVSTPCKTDFDCLDVSGAPLAGTNGKCANAKTKMIRDLERLKNISDLQNKLENYKASTGNYPNFTSGSYLKGQTVSRWSSWNDLGVMLQGIKNDPVNQWVGCSRCKIKDTSAGGAGVWKSCKSNDDCPGTGNECVQADKQTCWDQAIGSFICPNYSSVTGYITSTLANGSAGYKIYQPLEYFAPTSPILSDLNVNTGSFLAENVCTPGTLYSPFGDKCGDGVVSAQLGEECDPPGFKELSSHNGNGAICQNENGALTKAVRTCSDTCKWTYGACGLQNTCGNGRVEPGEKCDDGSSLNGTAGHCNSDCLGFSASICGNGYLDAPQEICDKADYINLGRGALAGICLRKSCLTEPYKYTTIGLGIQYKSVIEIATPAVDTQRMIVLQDAIQTISIDADAPYYLTGNKTSKVLTRAPVLNHIFISEAFTPPTNLLLTDIFFSDATHGWIVGTSGAIYKYAGPSSLGDSWVVQRSTVSDELNSVYFVNSSVGWTVGSVSNGGHSVILKTSNGGDSWRRQESGITQSLWSVFFIDTSRGWAVGSGGKIIVTVDGGVTWKEQVSGITNSLRSVYFVDANNGWATGDAGVILNTTDGGKNWNVQRSASVGINLVSIAFTNGHEGWAAGIRNGANYLLYTNDSGNNWLQKDNAGNTTVGLTGISVADSGDVWFGGYTSVGALLSVGVDPYCVQPVAVCGTPGLSSADCGGSSARADECVMIPDVSYYPTKENSCSADCKTYGGYCGDGKTQKPFEECDGESWCSKYCLNSSTSASAVAAQNIVNGCGNGTKESGEECDLGLNNGIPCKPEYGQKCQYCSAKTNIDNGCKTLYVEATKRCGNGVIDEISPGVSEACDINTASQTIMPGPNSSGIINASCSSQGSGAWRGDMVCKNNCTLLDSSSCVACGIKNIIESTPGAGDGGGVRPMFTILNPLYNSDVDSRSWERNEFISFFYPYDTSPYFGGKYRTGSRSIFVNSQGSQWPRNSLLDSNTGIETRQQCSSTYFVHFDDRQFSSNSEAGQISGDYFQYPVNNEGGSVTNEFVVSPVVPRDTIRAVVHWTDEEQKLGDPLFLGDVYVNAPVGVSVESLHNFYKYTDALFGSDGGVHSDLCTQTQVNQSGFYMPVYCNHPDGIFIHDVITNGKKNFIQGVTITPQVDKTYAFVVEAVANPAIGTNQPRPIAAFKNSKLTVDLYMVKDGQNPSSVYKPFKSFEIKNTGDTGNPLARYWHVFNFRKVGNDVVIEPVIDNGATNVGGEELLDGSIETDINQVRCNIPGDTCNAHELNITKVGDGINGKLGTIASVSNDVTCGVGCMEISKEYTEGSVVTLSASAGVDNVFLGWEGDCSGTGDCTVTMDRVKTVRVRFEGKRTLAITCNMPLGVSGNLTANYSSSDLTNVSQFAYAAHTNVNCPTLIDPVEINFMYGATVNLSATASGGIFSHWSNNVVCGNNNTNCHVIINSNMSIDGQFSIFTLHL